ncbi:unnamed protein product [Caenorhabditis sp. 36 PRJEB53466]|nr:unnamed protein product [Caenorhabditis sp. 36 PRJEB53466]
MSKSEVEIQAWFSELIHDHQNHFTARWARKYSEITGVEVDLLVKGTVLFVLGLLLVSKEPHYLANFLLVSAPIMVTFVEKSQRPSSGILFVYWSLFGLSVLFDRILEHIPCFYILKLALFVALFLPPSMPTIERIRQRIEGEQKNE